MGLLFSAVFVDSKYLFSSDNEAPILSCPMQYSYVLPGNVNGVATWSPPPTAVDTVEGPINSGNIVCSADSGSVVSGDTYPLGLTAVTCQASDSVPNQGSCNFDISVQVCYLNCMNGGTLDLTNCTCNCDRGWSGANCTACPLSNGSCENGGTFDVNKCGCVCPFPELSNVTCAGEHIIIILTFCLLLLLVLSPCD